MTKKARLIQHLRKIEIEKPSVLIIKQIEELIEAGVLRPGDSLPSESALAKAFDVKRGQVQEALRRLEFYGILKTLPQSGTFVADLGEKTLQGLISAVLRMGKEDFDSLMDTRIVLEKRAAELVTQNATDEEIQIIHEVSMRFAQHIKEDGRKALDEDIFFHLKIAAYSHSPVLESHITLLASELICQTRPFVDVFGSRLDETVREHTRIVEMLKLRDPGQAAAAMEEHLHHVLLAQKENE